MTTRTLKLLPHQFDLITDTTTKILGLCSGFGGGKTFAAARKAAMLAIANPGCDGIVTEPNYPLLTQILIPELKDAFEYFGIKYTFAKVDCIFHLDIDGVETRIICKSMEQYERAIGINAAWVICDEFDTTKPAIAHQAFIKLLGRIRVGNIRQFVIVSTPEGFGAMHKIFIESNDDQKRLIKAKTTDNYHLPQDYIDTLRSQYPEQLIAAYMDGEFVNLTSGSVYYNYSRERCRSIETIQPNEPLLIGQDFNVGKMASVIFVKRHNGYHAVGELVDLFDTPDVVRVLTERYKNNGHKIIIYPDASGQNRRSSGASQSDVNLLRNAGFDIRVGSINPAVKDRVLSVNKAFESDQLWVNDKLCPNIARCLEQQAYDKNGEPDKQSGHDHMNDAFGYPIAFEMPIIRPRINQNVSPIQTIHHWK